MTNERFEELYARTEPAIRRALVAAYGRDLGNEATDDAFAWAWANLEKVLDLENPAGYLYRVGQSSAKALRPRTPPSTGRLWYSPIEVDDRLAGALVRLTTKQRVAAVLHFGYALTYLEVAELMGISATAAQSHADRGMKKLRAAIPERIPDV